ncbi:MAG: M48 family metallopeptidase [Rubellimicrobium sp.]|nr:M48 family metallopeptidase [Rubellimicrobium sp.]
MDDLVIAGDPPVRVALRSSPRARRMSLRVSRLDGRVTLTLPHHVARDEGVAFARSRADWLRRHLAQVETGEAPHLGGTIPFLGQSLPLVAGPVRGPVLKDDALVLPDDPPRVARRVEVFLRTQARARLAEACDRHAAALGRPFRRITLRDPRSRWGSCSARGDLMFSWRLVMAPPEVLDYVAAHEVAHLAQMNHSPAFWAVVARLCPGHAAQRRWLREEGPRLHRLRFAP